MEPHVKTNSMKRSWKNGTKEVYTQKKGKNIKTNEEMWKNGAKEVCTHKKGKNIRSIQKILHNGCLRMTAF